MEFFKHNTRIDFMGQRQRAAVFSVLLFVLSISALFVYGLNLGLDFTGGNQFQLRFPQAANFQHIRNQLHEHGFKNVVVQAFGSSKQVVIKMPPHQTLTQDQLTTKLQQALPKAEIVQSQFIGPHVGKRLLTNGILAILISLLGTMMYIALRFEYRFSISAAVALIHDPILVLGIFSYFRVTFDLVSLAAVLTVIGYSLNDTIVVYDRIRENFRKMRKATPYEVVNASINQTLSRTIMTSGLTLIVVIALLIYGGETLRGFALALAIGIVIGTYSSIYVAGALALRLGLDRSSLLPSERKQTETMP